MMRDDATPESGSDVWSSVEALAPPSGAPSLIAALKGLRARGLDEPAARLTHHTSLRILSATTCGDLETFLKWEAARRDLSLDMSFGDFGVLHPRIAGVDGAEMLLILATLEDFAPDHLSGSADIGAALARLDQILDGAEGVTLLMTTLEPIQRPAIGSAASLEASATPRTADALNTHLRARAAASAGRLLLVDLCDVVARLGRDAAISNRLAYEAAAPLTHRALALTARAAVRSICAAKGLAKKCLVLDCDGVLWGGVVGEDGLNGVALGPETPQGRAHLDFQRAVLDLKRQGVVLALCSKNEEADVFEMLDDHPHCLLSREDVAAHRINWRDKAQNIAELAEELNLGLDSFVFIDDSRYECELVRLLLPEVTVRRAPDNVSELPTLAHAEGLFDRASLSAEDRDRTQMYRAEGARRRAKLAFTSVDAYLASLELWATVRLATPADAPRVAQLTQKTNQFNLTTLRMTVAEVEQAMASPDQKLFVLEAGDAFGDLGLVGVALFRRTKAARTGLDALLMSCRALGRGLDRHFLARSLDGVAEDWAPAEIEAVYRPTRKNAQVADFFDREGFALQATEPDGSKRYLGAPRVTEPPAFIRVASNAPQNDAPQTHEETA